MCIMSVSINEHPDYPFIWAGNRDEYFERVATPLEIGKDGLLCCRDSEAGGSWMGLNVKTGEFAALTNVRAPPSKPVRSRGELILRSLSGDAEAAIASGQYENYNLLFGRLSADGPPQLQFSVSAPPDPTPKTRAMAESSFAGVKSNDHGGEWTTAGRCDLSDECTWAKAVWLQRAVSDALATESVQAARGEAGARDVLLGALIAQLSASTIGEDGLVAAAAAAKPSAYSPCTAAAETRMHAAPFVMPFTGAGPNGAADGQYGTVSQSIVIQCRSERCVFYAYRTVSAETKFSEWAWRRVDLT